MSVCCVDYAVHAFCPAVVGGATVAGYRRCFLDTSLGSMRDVASTRRGVVCAMALLEQQAEVIAVLPGQVAVRPLTATRCERCASGQGCGGQWRLRASENAPLLLTVAPAGPTFSVGDQVVIGLPAAAFQPALLMLYGLPVLVLVLAAMLFRYVSLPDAPASLLALVLFAFSLWRVHHRLRRQTLPVVRILRVLPQSCEQPPVPD